ncbi:MAG: hypothetical protein AMJ56_02375, partial [Anaerolineae bacterium SG8_19]
FIAIDLPEVVRQELASISYDLNLKVPNKSIRWVRPENIHLTLKFLGDTTVERLNQISGGLDRVGGDNPQIDLNLNKLGCFPNPRRPRIVWVDVNGDLDSIGWELDKRKFHPHLTLGRVKNSLQVEGSGLPWGSQVKPVTFTVDSLKLYESVLKSSGAVYSIRHISQLGGQKGSSSNS